MKSPLQSAPAALVGCAGWNLPSSVRADFPDSGSQLQRYAARFNAVEINSSFYRPHRPTTYRRWADSVPPAFRFAVKMPRAVSHQARLVETGAMLDQFLSEAAELREKLGCLLLQLPPSLAFDSKVAENFFITLRARSAVPIVCEPRHPSWFDARANPLLAQYRIARVDADPAPCAIDAPPVFTDPIYLRLHGSPVMYRSSYSDAYLDHLAARISEQQQTVWCVFDNTANGAAQPNALALLDRLRAPG